MTRATSRWCANTSWQGTMSRDKGARHRFIEMHLRIWDFEECLVRFYRFIDWWNYYLPPPFPAHSSPWIVDSVIHSLIHSFSQSVMRYFLSLPTRTSSVMSDPRNQKTWDSIQRSHLNQGLHSPWRRIVQKQRQLWVALWTSKKSSKRSSKNMTQKREDFECKTEDLPINFSSATLFMTVFILAMLLWEAWS